MNVAHVQYVLFSHVDISSDFWFKTTPIGDQMLHDHANRCYMIMLTECSLSVHVLVVQGVNGHNAQKPHNLQKTPRANPIRQTMQIRYVWCRKVALNIEGCASLVTRMITLMLVPSVCLWI